ncbi:hypothetical protein MVES1_000172 [Malassezia vespertilionis]|uniref:uncharacterized protein n=1 Tax=Malassezia vespertilionis TaxID=2020962 RepID=UPI0024B1739E|nr:uncharacterized protein MVES1_000172 [Malassezia vespertilionis]WFD04848.1 hypothetical protein MVES1_000172 [Malassezia vespertilionis]
MMDATVGHATATATPVAMNVEPCTPRFQTQPMVSPTSSAKRRAEDRFYGHRLMAEVSERFLMCLFSCSQNSMATTADTAIHKQPCTPRLAHFVAYALYRTRLPMTVVYTALLLLLRLKTRYPVARGSSGHRLFISAFMLATKMLCDDSYNNKSWAIVGQGLFTLVEINQMERELLGYLDLKLDVAPGELAQFTATLEKYGAPALSLTELNTLCLGAPVRSHTPHTTSSPTDAPRSKSAHRRRPLHRRSLSLRPDFWTQAHGPPLCVSGMPRRADSEWSMQQAVRACPSRASLPAQRNATSAAMFPAMPPYAASAASVAAMASVAAVPNLMLSESHRSPMARQLYATENTSSLSIATPGSISSIDRLTPSTSLSDFEPSPWTNAPTLQPFHHPIKDAWDEVGPHRAPFRVPNL